MIVLTEERNEIMLQPKPQKLMIGTLIGSALMLLLIPNAALAQSNQSDNTGTNPEPINPIVDPVVEPIPPGNIPNDVPGNQSNTDVLEVARRLSEELKKAYDACLISRTAANVPTNVPRRFARGAADPNAPPCLSSECLELDRTKQEVQAFLSRLDQAQLQQLQETRTIRLW
jgi:hypothetical protein